MSRADWVREHASRPQGVTAAELAEAFGLTGPRASTFLSKRRTIKSEPLLCARQLGHPARYFVHAADMAAYVQATPSVRWDAPERQAEYNRRKTLARRIARGISGGRSRRRVSDPTSRPIKAQAPAGPVDYSRAVVTVYPTPAPRFAAAGPVPRVVDAGQCRAWAAGVAR